MICCSYFGIPYCVSSGGSSATDGFFWGLATEQPSFVGDEILIFVAKFHPRPPETSPQPGGERDEFSSDMKHNGYNDILYDNGLFKKKYILDAQYSDI